MCCSVPVTRLAFSIPSIEGVLEHLDGPAGVRQGLESQIQGVGILAGDVLRIPGHADVLFRYEAALFREAREFMGQFDEGPEQFPLSGLRVARRSAHRLFLLSIEFCGSPLRPACWLGVPRGGRQKPGSQDARPPGFERE